jgi:peptide/nickel transport system permease protein/oligopeptide transport system permease protein
MSDLVSSAAVTQSEPGGPGSNERAASLWGDAWRQLRRSPVAICSSLFILLVCSMAVFPFLWTSQDPRACDVKRSRISPSWDHPFGFDILGCDYYSFLIYGARPTLTIAVGSTAGIVFLGGLTGMLAGYYGRWVDVIVSRITEIFMAIPFLLGALVFLSMVRGRGIWAIVLILVVLGWTTISRLMRGSVLASKNLDYVQAARALGASNARLMFRHILPNAIAPVVVYATIALAAFVSAEATLTFLGGGLVPPAQSWGIAIANHQVYFLQDPWLLVFPCALLVGTVLSFVLLGDALRDALDPKLR